MNNKLSNRTIPGYYNQVEFVKPIGIKEKKWREYLDWLNHKEIPARKKAVQRRVKRYTQTQRLLVRLSAMEYPTFITITFSDEQIQRSENDIIRSIREWFARQNIDKWVLVTDYGSDEEYIAKDGSIRKGTRRFHLHGFVNVPTLEFIHTHGLKYQKHKQHYSVYSGPITWGFLSVNKTFDNTPIERCVYYCTKYITKDLNDELPKDHKIVGSRIGERDELALIAELFGDLVEVVN